MKKAEEKWIEKTKPRTRRCPSLGKFSVENFPFVFERHFSSAFTLVEVLVVIAITVIIATLGISSFVSFSKREALDADTMAIVAGLRDARAETLASVNGSQYGIALAPDKFTFFQGSTYNSVATENKIFDLSSYSHVSGDISTIVFERLTGNSNASGTIDVYLVSDPTVKRTIGISSTGLVNVQK